jgi:hypothetical protein
LTDKCVTHWCVGTMDPVEPWQTRAWPCSECRARHAPCGIAASDVVTHLATDPSGRNRHQRRGSTEKQVTEHAPEPAEEPEKRPPGHVRETVVIIVLSITAVLTAWCGFESSKWSGEMSIAFSQASSARIEAARQQGIANAARQADLTIWGVYVQARAQRDTVLAAYVERRFTDHFRVAYQAWLAQGEPTTGPFKMKEYVPPGTTESEAADQRADSRFADALKFNQRGDNYTILTVLFALVLFFAAASTRLGRSRAQWILLGVAITILVAATVTLATFPIDF